MKGKLFFGLLVFTLVALLLLGACPEPAPETTTTPTPTQTQTPTATSTPEPIELRYNHMSPPGPLYDGIHGQWVNEVMERCGGKVNITTYYVGQLSPPEESYNSLLTGLADIATLHAPLNPGRFPCRRDRHNGREPEGCCRRRASRVDRYVPWVCQGRKGRGL